MVSNAFKLTRFHMFCIRWSVLFDSSTDQLSRVETTLRALQASPVALSMFLTVAPVLFTSNKKALESAVYLIIGLFMMGIVTFAIRTKRFNRGLLLMIEREFPEYDRPVPKPLTRKLAAIRTSYSDFTQRVMVMYLALVLFEVPATAMVPLTAATTTDAKLGTQPTLLVVGWFPADTSQVCCALFSVA